MNVGIITKPNSKGQIVIPKEMREALGVDASVALNLILRGGGIYIYPVEEVITKGEKGNAYLEVLKKTQGAWTREDWDALRKRRRKTEIAASRERKKAW